MDGLVIPKPGPRGSVLSPPARNRSKPTEKVETPPTQDGMLVVTSASGHRHEYLYKNMHRGWRVYNRYLSVSTETGWVNWPWGSMLNWETVHNSPEYRSAASEKRTNGDA